MPAHPALDHLRRQLAEDAARHAPADAARVGFGCPDLDAALDGGLACAALHEVYAAGLDGLPAATIVALGLAVRAAEGRPILWARQDALDAEAGRPHPPGLAELGIDPGRVILVRGRDAAAVLRAGAEAARCTALGAVLIQPFGAPRQLDLTASRRLALIAETSGVLTLLLREARPEPSAARSRWLVEPAASRALEANAPGDPAVLLRLLRLRGGRGEGEWHLEWNRDRHRFQPGGGRPAVNLDDDLPAADREPGGDGAALPGAVVAFPADGPPRADRALAPRRRAG